MVYTRAIAERRRFWGRQAELALVRNAITTSLKGPALLRECGSVAAAAGVRVVNLDVRDVDATPAGLLRALGESVGTPEPLDALQREAAVFLAIDSYESISALDGWIRRTLLRQLPARTIVMMASRPAPPIDWTTDPEVEPGFRAVALRTLVPGEPIDGGAAQIAVLSKAEFEAAVRQALRDYRHPEKLALNPLRSSRLLVDDPGPGRLQAVLRDALDQFKAVRRDEKFHRALFHTFFEPAPTQEAAAERLGLPFNTYRYQLTRGTERLVEWLWRRELCR
jgi:hypothetical protein